MNSLGEYIPRLSWVHRRDPRTKIITVIVLSIMVLQVKITGLIIITGMALVVSQLAHIPSRVLIKTLRPTGPLFFFLFLLYILVTPGHPLPGFPIGPLQATCQGLHLGVLQVWRFLLMVIAASILTMTTLPSELTLGLEWLLRPLRVIGVSSHNVAMMVSLALRFIPTLLDEMNMVKEAGLARGADFNSRRISGRLKAVKVLVLPLSLSVLRRSDELVDAMEARGYQQGSRTYLYELTFTPADYCIITIIIAALAAVLITN